MRYQLGYYCHANAVVQGDVEIGPEAGIWPGAVVRGDVAPLRIGAGTNIQDNATVHAVAGIPNTVGCDITVGHNAVLHGTSVGDRCLIGMGAVLLGASVIGEGCIIAAGAVVKEGATIPSRSVVAGVPGKIRRNVTDHEWEWLLRRAEHYRRLARLWHEHGVLTPALLGDIPEGS